MVCSKSMTEKKLTICITTFNRGRFIGETLDSILPQLTSACEILVIDGASSDNTQEVVAEYSRRFDSVLYVRQEENRGFDRDCDRAVELASGEYCWLMTDDDLLKPGAIDLVLAALDDNPSLVIVNAELRDFTLSKILQSHWLDLKVSRRYGTEEMDRLAVETSHILGFVACIVVRRDVWIARERKMYYDSWFIFIGVIFQKKLPADSLVLAEPLIVYRSGNSHSWSSRTIEIVFVKWPEVVQSLALSDSAKEAVCSASPWRDLKQLLMWRGAGFYSLKEYRRWVKPRVQSTGEAVVTRIVAVLPGSVINALFVIYYSLNTGRYRGIWEPPVVIEIMRESRFYFRRSFSGRDDV